MQIEFVITDWKVKKCFCKTQYCLI